MIIQLASQAAVNTFMSFSVWLWVVPLRLNGNQPDPQSCRKVGNQDMKQFLLETSLVLYEKRKTNLS